MKTREEQRFHASLAFATVLLSAQRITGTSFCMAEAMEYADTLLAELDRTAPKPETPIPDADGWIPHRPGDPMPCDGSMRVDVRHHDGTISCNDTAQFWESGDSGMLSSSWTGLGDDPDCQIIAWKPA